MSHAPREDNTNYVLFHESAPNRIQRAKPINQFSREEREFLSVALTRDHPENMPPTSKVVYIEPISRRGPLILPEPEVWVENEHAIDAREYGTNVTTENISWITEGTIQKSGQTRISCKNGHGCESY